MRKARKRSSLNIRCSKRTEGFPPDLLARLNATAAMIPMDRDEFVTELLRQEMQRLEPIQKEIREWFQARSQTKKSSETK